MKHDVLFAHFYYSAYSRGRPVTTHSCKWLVSYRSRFSVVLCKICDRLNYFWCCAFPNRLLIACANIFESWYTRHIAKGKCFKLTISLHKKKIYLFNYTYRVCGFHITCQFLSWASGGGLFRVHHVGVSHSRYLCWWDDKFYPFNSIHFYPPL